VASDGSGGSRWAVVVMVVGFDGYHGMGHGEMSGRFRCVAVWDSGSGREDKGGWELSRVMGGPDKYEAVWCIQRCGVLKRSLQRREVENRLVFERSLLPSRFLGS